jgi:hypothetical protein
MKIHFTLLDFFSLCLLILLILLVFSQVCLGQEKSEVILVDRFGDLGCGDIMGRTDQFFVEILNDPKS